MNTESKSENSSTNKVSAEELAKQYIKNTATGALYHVLQDKKSINNLHLRSKNRYESCNKLKLEQGIVDGKWITPNVHEIKKHIEEENAYFEALTYRLVKRIMFTQLLLELDDELVKDYSDDKYVSGLLKRCEKEFLRLVLETYPKMYSIDKQMLISFMNNIDSFVGKIAKLQVHEFVIANKMIDDYLADPNTHTPEIIQLDKIDADAE